MPKGIYDRSKSKKRPSKIYKSRKWLYENYILQKRSTVDIAKDLSVSWQAVKYWLHKYKIPLRDSRSGAHIKWMAARSAELLTKYKITKEYLVREYVTNRKTLNQIAAEFGCSWDVVRRRIHKYGIEPKFNRKLRTNFTKRLSAEQRRFQKLLLRMYGYKCAICSYDKFVHACHIEPRYKSGASESNNGIVLCPNHHHELDFGILGLDDVKKFQVNKT